MIPVALVEDSPASGRASWSGWGGASTDGRTLYYENADFVERRPLVEFGIATATHRDVAAAGVRLDGPVPHPASGSAAFRFTIGAPGGGRLSVYDMLGREVARLHEGVASGETTVPLDASRLAPGTYLVRLSTEDGSASRLLVVY